MGRAAKGAWEAERPPLALRRACASGERAFDDLGQLLALIQASIVEGRGFDRLLGELRSRALREHVATRAFLLARQLIEPHLQCPEAVRNESGMNAIDDLVRVQDLEDCLQIVIQSRLLAFERMKARAAKIVHERLKPADTSQRVEASFHRLAGNEPDAEAANKGFDRWFDRKVEQQQTARGDKRRGDEKDLDLWGEPVDQRQRQIDYQRIDYIG
jgi:hypothetical protein